MVQKKAVVIKGDGTGPELVKCMMDVLKACNSSIDLIPVEAGSEFWEKNKTNILTLLRKFGNYFLKAMLVSKDLLQLFRIPMLLEV